LSLGSWGAELWRRIRSGSPRPPDASPTKTGPADLEEVFPWERVYPEELHWRTHIRPHPLFTILDQSVREFPDRPCVDFMGRRYTYAEIGDLVNRAAKGLAALGLRKGSRVGLLMPNCPYYVIGYFAALKVGATVVNYNPMLSSS
jgi:long-chain acyl-CoA synthetase